LKTTDEANGDELRQPGSEQGLEDAVSAAFEREVAEANRRADENWDRYLRAEADLENLRRAAERRRIEATAFERRRLLTAFLGVADNLERALTHAGGDPDALIAGVEATLRALFQMLEAEGVAPIEAQDSEFDPEKHEAIGVVDLPDVDGERVVSVEQPGYTLSGELLRPARVVVGRGQPAEPGPDSGS
jgi:molecular chaperone GrpE